MSGREFLIAAFVAYVRLGVSYSRASSLMSGREFLIGGFVAAHERRSSQPTAPPLLWPPKTALQTYRGLWFESDRGQHCAEEPATFVSLRWRDDLRLVGMALGDQAAVGEHVQGHLVGVARDLRGPDPVAELLVEGDGMLQHVGIDALEIRPFDLGDLAGRRLEHPRLRLAVGAHEGLGHVAREPAAG